jgi:hypothetical protein
MLGGRKMPLPLSVRDRNHLWLLIDQFVASAIRAGSTNLEGRPSKAATEELEHRRRELRAMLGFDDALRTAARHLDDVD